MTTTSSRAPAPEPLPVTRWRDDGAAAIDCETAVLLRAHLVPHLSAAESWADLVHRLSTKNLRIVLQAGQPAVVEVAGGGELCSLAFLGHDIDALRRRFGRPVVAPMPGRAGAGIIRG